MFKSNVAHNKNFYYSRVLLTMLGIAIYLLNYGIREVGPEYETGSETEFGSGGEIILGSDSVSNRQHCFFNKKQPHNRRKGNVHLSHGGGGGEVRTTAGGVDGLMRSEPQRVGEMSEPQRAGRMELQGLNHNMWGWENFEV